MSLRSSTEGAQGSGYSGLLYTAYGATKGRFTVIIQKAGVLTKSTLDTAKTKFEAAKYVAGAVYNTAMVLIRGPMEHFETVLRNGQINGNPTYHASRTIPMLGRLKGCTTIMNYLLVTSLDQSKQILKEGRNKNGSPYCSGELYEHTKLLTGGPNLLTVPHEVHADFVSVMHFFFSKAYALTKWQVAQKHAQKRIEFMISQTKINATQQMPIYTSSTISDSLLGFETDDEKLSEHISTLTEAVFRLMYGIPIRNLSEVETAKEYLGKIADEVYSKAAVLESVSDKDPFIANMAKKTKTDENGKITFRFSCRDVQSMIMTLFIAGQETTAVLSQHALRILCQYPEWQDILCKEISKFSLEDLFNAKEPSKLECFLSEVMRQFPPAPGEARFDPEKNEIVILLNVISQGDANRWTNPQEFNPSRFEVKKSPFRGGTDFIPFGHGAEKCPGSWYAYMMAMTFFYTLIKQARVEFAVYNDGRVAPRFMLALAKPLEIKVIARNTSAKANPKDET